MHGILGVRMVNSLCLHRKDRWPAIETATKAMRANNGLYTENECTVQHINKKMNSSENLQRILPCCSVQLDFLQETERELGMLLLICCWYKPLMTVDSKKVGIYSKKVKPAGHMARVRKGKAAYMHSFPYYSLSKSIISELSCVELMPK
jgi:hypothetical protein